MEEIRLFIGLKLILDNATKWRIFSIDNFICRVIQCNIEKKVIETFEIPKLMEKIHSGQISIAEDQENYIVDYNLLSPTARNDYDKKLSFINEFKDMYGPSFLGYLQYGNKDAYKELYTRYGMSLTLAERTVRRWLQSGMQNYSLCNPKLFIKAQNFSYSYNKKPGRKPSEEQGIILDDYAKTAFEFGIDLYKSKRLITIKESYVRMLMNFYYTSDNGQVNLLPPDKRPTERQFRTYLKKVLSHEEVRKIKTSNEEYRNNERLLMGSPRDASLRPGNILEADALEIDINIVASTDMTLNVRRPILYMMIDMYSHAIVAFHVGFENNSMLGLSSLMMNLMEDREMLLQQKGIYTDISAWPAPFIPKEIRCDRGSDFASDKFENICKELRITRTLETGAMGSMKGLIEQSFRLFHQTIKPEFEKLGIIQKRYDSNHFKEASLTLSEMFILIVEFIRYHNTFYTKNFRLTENMLLNEVGKRPIDIWNYGIEHFGAPDPVTVQNRASYMFSLMIEAKASISREGITYKNILYICKNDEEILQRMKMAKVNAGKRNPSGELLNSMIVRYDPRSINHIYYLKNGQLQILEINSGKCGGLKDMTWEEYEDFMKKEKKLDAEGRESNLTNMANRIQFTSGLASIASNRNYAVSMNIRELRKEENNREKFEDRISRKISSDVEESPDTILDDSTKPMQKVKKVELTSTDGDSPLLSSECPDDLFDF